MKKLTTLLLAILWVAAVATAADQQEQSFGQVTEAAEQGDADAQFRLAQMYYVGDGVPKDLAQAARWFRAAAEQGVASAQYNLGGMYFDGEGVPKNLTEAARWYRAAAEQGHAISQFSMGQFHYFGGFGGLPKDLAEAARWYRAAAEQGDADAQYSLGKMYQDPHNDLWDLGEAARLYRAAAEQGHADAQYNLGVLYRNGHGVPQDSAEAVRWYRAAAEQGYANAQYNLGLMYDNGEGVPEDDREAVRWYRAAAEQGHASAQFNLARTYLLGEGVPQDYREAARWLRAAAEQGDASAQFNLGVMYDTGRGVPEDDREAARWLRAAAEQGHATAQFDLGVMYAKGDGTPKDLRQAVRWTRAAAEQGHANAQFNLGRFYAHGNGGLLSSGAAAADWYYRAGLSYLKDGQREDALLCVERIQNLQKVLGLTVPNARVADQLYAAISGTDSAPGYVEKQPSEETQPTTFGTGWVVEGGLIVTCYHVIEGLDSVAIRTPGGGNTPATVVVVDPANDLAILRAEDLTILRSALPVSSRIRTGESVFTIGYPHPDLLGLEAKLTDGIVSAQSGVGGDIRVLQISAPVQAGNSGGPLLNMRGEVVGIVVSKLDAAKVLEMTGDLPENVNYAVKTAYLGPLLASAEPARKVRLLPAAPASLADLASRVEDAVVLVVGR